MCSTRSGEGRFAQLLRFEARPRASGVIGFGELIAAALGNFRTSAAGFVILAESAGLVGSDVAPLAWQRGWIIAAGLSAVRDWLSFTTETHH